jgi:hypothetical protein
MMSEKAFTFMIVDEDEQVRGPYWRRPFSRFGCPRSRRILDRFPKRADAIARATVEGGSRLRAGKVVRHG